MSLRKQAGQEPLGAFGSLASGSCSFKKSMRQFTVQAEHAPGTEVFSDLNESGMVTSEEKEVVEMRRPEARMDTFPVLGLRVL